MARKSVAPAAPSDAAAPTQNKTALVKELMKSGLKMPKEISVAAAKVGVTITPNYVSMIKGGMRKGKKSAKRVERILKKAGRKVTKVQGTSAAAGDHHTENLALRFALKCGGVENAIATLQKLQ